MGGRFYPTLFFLDEDGKKIGEHDVYAPRTAEAFTATLAKVERARTLRKRAEADGEGPPPTERVELFLLDAELGLMDYYEAEDRAGKLGELEGDAGKKVGEVLVNFEVEDLMQPPPRTPQARIDLGLDFRELAEAGRVPTKPGLLRSFWMYQLIAAEAGKDVPAFETALAGFKKAFGDDERFARRIDAYEKKLEELRAEAGKGTEEGGAK